MNDLTVKVYSTKGKLLDTFTAADEKQAMSLLDVNLSAVAANDGFKVRIEDATGSGCWLIVGAR